MIGQAFSRLWNDKRGNILVIAGAALPMLVGSAGLATDTIQWTLWKRQLQRAADSAAIAGVYERVRAAGVNTNVNAVVTRDLVLNQHTGIALRVNPAITYPADTTTTPTMIRQVAVRLEVQRALSFSSMFMSTAPIIAAVATAASVPGGDDYCVIGLDPRSTITGIDIGGSTTLDMGKCSLIANSTNPNNAATNTGNGSTVKARSLAAAGGVQSSKNWTVDKYDPYTTPVVDPFLTLPMPPKTDCHTTITVSKKQQDYPITLAGGPAIPSGKVTCITGGLDIAGNLTLGSGTYVIDGGNLNMNSTGTSLNCSGCTIILTNSSNPATTGNIRLNGGTVNITAPTTGTYKGIALYQDRRATDDGSKSQNHVNGNSGAAVTGVIYTPSRSLLYNGGGGLASVCMQIIGRRVEFTGNSNIKISSECGDAGLGVIGGGRKVRLVA